MQKPVFDHLSIKLTNGRIETARWDELSLILRHWATILLVFASDLLTLAFSGIVGLRDLEVWKAFMILVGANLGTVALTVLLLALGQRLLRREVPSLHVNSLVALAQTAYAIVVGMILNPTYTPLSEVLNWILFWAYLVVQAELLLLVFVLAVIPFVRAETAKISPTQKAIPSDESQSRETSAILLSENMAMASVVSPRVEHAVVLNGKIMPTASIRYLKAERNYVHVYCEDSELFIHSTLSSIVAQIPSELGIRINRSYWVSFRNIDQLRRLGRDVMVELPGGEQIPISRSGQKEILTKIRGRMI